MISSSLATGSSFITSDNFFEGIACDQKLMYLYSFIAAIAQLIEQVICNHQVGGLSPSGGTTEEGDGVLVR